MISRLSPTLQGIALMILAMACFAVMSVLIRGLSADIPSPLLVFLRNAFALGMMLPWLMKNGVPALKTRLIWRHAWRAAVGITAMALVFLGEKAGFRRWSALIIGFAGTLLITRPGSEHLDSGALIVLVASALIAITSILVKTLTREETAGRILFYMAFFMTLFSLVPSLPYWQVISPMQYAGIFVIAFASVMAHICLIAAYRRAEMVVLMPFDFTRLLFTAALAYFAFDEVLDMWDWIGAMVIVGAAVYISWREQKVKKILTPEEEKAAAGTLPV